MIYLLLEEKEKTSKGLSWRTKLNSSFYDPYLIDMEGPIHGVSAHWRSVAEPQAGAHLQALQLTFQYSAKVVRFPVFSVLDHPLIIFLAVRSPLLSLLGLKILSTPNNR